jgi:hypothetical protein
VTYCPDCGKDIPSDLFVSHREAEHSPTGVRTISVPGIASSERFGYQTSPEE